MNFFLIKSFKKKSMASRKNEKKRGWGYMIGSRDQLGIEGDNLGSLAIRR